MHSEAPHKLFMFLASIMFTFSVPASAATLLLPDSLAMLSENVTKLTMNLRYKDAHAQAQLVRKSNEGVGCVLENIVRISRYDDLGDTTSLQRAGVELEKCTSEGMWDALRKFELGYVKSESGHYIKGAMETRSAAKIFEDSKELEPRAFYAIYAYYVDNSFSWVPFKSDNRKEYLHVLDSASKKSKQFWPLFLTPLIWMHYDNNNFETGLKLAERALFRSPNHPVFLQIKADMLYRLKRYNEASKIYVESANTYMNRTGKSIRYWCSVLNLIRIYHDSHDIENEKIYREKLKDSSFEALKKWMPASLMDDLKKRNLI